jgi:hypothetical protein
MKIGDKISLKASGSEGVVIEGNHANDSVPASLVYVQLKSGKKFYYHPNDLKALKKKIAAKKAATPKKEETKEPVAKKAPAKKEKKES